MNKEEAMLLAALVGGFLVHLHHQGKRGCSCRQVAPAPAPAQVPAPQPSGCTTV